MKDEISHRASIAIAAIKTGKISPDIQALLDYIVQLERRDTERDVELDRLLRIESAADDVFDYHSRRHDPDFEFSVNQMARLLNKLGDLL